MYFSGNCGVEWLWTIYSDQRQTQEMIQIFRIQQFIIIIEVMAVINEFSELELKNLKEEDPPIVLDDKSEKSGLTLNKKYLSCLCFFGGTVYIGTRNSKLYIYQFEDQKFTNQQIIIPHCQIVSSITATHKFFVSVPQSDDQTVVSIWNAKDKYFLTALKGHKSQVSKVIFLREEGYIATSSWDSTVKVWYIDQKLTNDDEFKNFNAGGYPILTLEEDKNTETLILGGDDCYLTFWNWKKDEVVGKVFGHAGSVTFIYSFSPFILTGGGDDMFKVIQCERFEEMIEKKNEEKSDPKSAYQISIRSEIKKQYDSNLYGVPIEGNNLFLMDRQGNMFLFNYKNEESMKIAGNKFSYNESVTGLERFDKYLFVTTTKGAIKVFTYKLKQ